MQLWAMNQTPSVKTAYVTRRASRVPLLPKRGGTLRWAAPNAVCTSHVRLALTVNWLARACLCAENAPYPRPRLPL